MATRDYSSVSSIKEFAVNELAPKYFNMNETNDLNLGLLGYTTELIGSIAEDSFNTVTTFMNEIFPNLAIIPENIFNYAALFQIDSGFGTAASVNMILFVPEDSILRFATKVANSNDLYEFFLDSDMIISVEDIRFKPDYDIKINYKRYRNDIIYTAMYDMQEYGAPYVNSISHVTNPYIKIKRINYERVKYLQLEITAHQVDKFDLNDNIVDSTIINLPKYTITYDDYIANFEVFYKEPNSNTYVQLQKRMLGSSPIKEPFCYYKTIDENRLEISFTSRDNYFQPQYNSEINISYYTTTGEAGNFVEYTGNMVVVTPSSVVYDYNNNLSLFAIPISGAHEGSNPPTLEQLKNIILEKFSTVESYTNENDLQLYFQRFNNTSDSDILFIKKRDDIFERLFSAFMLLRDKSKEIYNTNTLDLLLTTKDFDVELEQADMYIMKPGHLFKYQTGILDTALNIPDVTVKDHASINEKFVYTNPFLIYFSKGAAGTNYYLNTFEKRYVVDYSWVNENSLVQFICNSLTVKRDAISGSNKYTITLSVTPTTDLDNPMVLESEDENGEIVTTISDSIKVKLFAMNDDTEVGYLDMKLSSWDLDNDIYQFTCELETDDYMLSDNRFRVLNLLDPSSNENVTYNIIHMTDCVLKIKIDYTYAEPYISRTHTLTTNEYLTKTNPVTFIEPIAMMRSTSEYVYNNDGEMDDFGYIHGGTYSIRIKSCPLVRASLFDDPVAVTELYENLAAQYKNVESLLEIITNNYSIDVKFYNTYGKSRNFFIDGDKAGTTLLDKVNISIRFKVHPVFGTDEEVLIRDLRIFIKEYIENISNSGTNSFYISNLIRRIENNFTEIEYLKFEGINDYSTDVQAIENLTIDPDLLTKNERINYVPEYLTLNLNNIEIEIIR